MRKSEYYSKSGFFIIEALLSIVIFSIVILSVFSMISFLQRRAVQSSFESDAALVLQDGMEIAHSALLSNWNGYPDNSYHPVFDANLSTWTLFSGEESDVESRYTRKIEISRVCRDANTGEIIEFVGSICGGGVDELTRQIITTVGWLEQGETKEISAALLILNTK